MTAAIVTAERSSIAKAAQSKDKPEKPYEVRAEKPLGLLLRVQPSGSRTFYVQIRRGKRVRIGPAGTYTLKQAEEVAKKILVNPESATAKKEGMTDTLADYLENHYKAHAKATLKNGEDSVARVKSTWAKLLNKRISEISPNEIDRLRNGRINIDGVKPATVNRDLSALKGVLTHWKKRNKGAVSPAAELVDLDVADDEVIRYLTEDEAARLRQALADRDTLAAAERRNANAWRRDRGYELMPEIDGYSDHITPMVLISLNTGVRQGELFSMTWESVSIERRNLSVLASHAKGNKTRNIPLNDEALKVFNTIKPKRATGLVFVSPKTESEFDNVKKAWTELIKKADIPGLRWHDMRHDFASQLVMKGVPLFTVQQLLGHSNPKTTMRYAKLAHGNLADAVNVLAQGSPK
jgi:integrase